MPFFMQNSNDITEPTHLDAPRYASCDTDAEQTVVLEWVVPVAAKVPALSQPVAVAKIVQQASITSTVPGQLLTQLRTNNTAWRPGWCITATLAASPAPARLAQRY